MPETKHPDATASRAQIMIRSLIDSGEVGQSDELPGIDVLAARFRISHRAIRHALDVLEAEGLIWRRHGTDAFAGPRPEATARWSGGMDPNVEICPLVVMEARIAIEPEIAALAASRATSADIARLRVIAHRTFSEAGAEETELWDGSFHRLIAGIADNPVLSAAFGLINELRASPQWQSARDSVRTGTLRREYDNHHRLIIDALEAGDAEAARGAMRAHLWVLHNNYKRRSETSPDPLKS